MAGEDQAALLLALPAADRRAWIRLLPPDDSADAVQAAPWTAREDLLALLDEPTREDVRGLLAYREDVAGGVMDPRYVRVRPEMTADEAVAYVREQARVGAQPLHSVYVERLAAALPDRRDGRHVGHTLDDLLRQRIYQIALGYED